MTTKEAIERLETYINLDDSGVSNKEAAEALGVLRGCAEELEITNKILIGRNMVLDAIPPCPMHGKQCVPHALEWIRQGQAEEIEDLKVSMGLLHGDALRRENEMKELQYKVNALAKQIVINHHFA